MEDNNILPQLVGNGYCNSTSWAEMRLVQATGSYTSEDTSGSFAVPSQHLGLSTLNCLNCLQVHIYI